MLEGRSSGMAVRRRIQASIVKLIETGRGKPGEIVDSERELAKIYGKPALSFPGTPSVLVSRLMGRRNGVAFSPRPAEWVDSKMPARVPDFIALELL
jgi:hypothetical protein